jgi:hypothetical protein
MNSSGGKKKHKHKHKHIGSKSLSAKNCTVSYKKIRILRCYAGTNKQIEKKSKSTPPRREREREREREEKAKPAVYPTPDPSVFPRILVLPTFVADIVNVQAFSAGWDRELT